jgi:6-phosphofructokinase 1
MRVAVLTSGGDAPGMNAAVYSVVKTARGRGHEVLGIERGYEGLLDREAPPLELRAVDGITRFGGTVLGTARSMRFMTEEGQADAAKALEELGIDALVVIGGNGSLTGAHKLAQLTDRKILGVPASIDNDVGHSGLCIGVDTAVNTIVDACDRILDTARAHRRAFIVEVMGRHCGYLAMRAGIAADADAILFAEREVSETVLVDRLHKLLHDSFNTDRGKGRVLIVKAEGVKVPTAVLKERLSERIAADPALEGVNVRESVLGHIVRGGRPTATDRVVAKRLCYAAVLAAEQGVSDAMLAWEPATEAGMATPDRSVRVVPLAEVLAETERLLDGSSPVTRGRVKLLEEAEGIMAL